MLNRGQRQGNVEKIREIDCGREGSGYKITVKDNGTIFIQKVLGKFLFSTIYDKSDI